MHRILRCLLVAAGIPAAASAAQLPDDFAEETVASGLAQPVALRFLPDGRILVAEQNTARIRVLRDGVPTSPDPALTVPLVNTQGQERGLLSIAVDPGWPGRNFVYAFYDYEAVPTQKDVRVTRYTASGDLDGTGDGSLQLDPFSALHILVGIPDEEGNHNGGDLRFGRDGMLYVSTGDDEHTRCLAQSRTSLLGKLLRLRVDQLSPTQTGTLQLADVDPGDNPFQNEGPVAALVHAIGLRNPFRFQVDPATGSLMVADVGKNRWEELSHVETAGLNLGWPHREGTADTTGDPAIDLTNCPTPPPGFTNFPPIAVFPNSTAAPHSIIAGPVYRAAGKAAAWPAEYEGDVFYADFYDGFLVRLSGSGQSYSVETASGQPNPNHWATGLDAPADFALDGEGNLYYVSASSGQIRRFVYTGPSPVVPRSMGSVKARFGGEKEER